MPSSFDRVRGLPPNKSYFKKSANATRIKLMSARLSETARNKSSGGRLRIRGAATALIRFRDRSRFKSAAVIAGRDSIAGVSLFSSSVFRPGMVWRPLAPGFNDFIFAATPFLSARPNFNISESLIPQL